MRIAIIGGGISGLTVGYRLHEQFDVTLFEANDYVGGHTNTINIPTDNGDVAVDTGFIVFNDRTYPNFIALLNKLSVPFQNTESGDNHKPDAIMPSLTTFAFERFLPSLTLWLSPRTQGLLLGFFKRP